MPLLSRARREPSSSWCISSVIISAGIDLGCWAGPIDLLSSQASQALAMSQISRSYIFRLCDVPACTSHCISVVIQILVGYGFGDSVHKAILVSRTIDIIKRGLEGWSHVRCRREPAEGAGDLKYAAWGVKNAASSWGCTLVSTSVHVVALGQRGKGNSLWL
jgi:hypothetical protein